MVQPICEILIPAMVQFPEQEDHQEIKKEDSDPVIKDPSFGTYCEMREFATHLAIEVDAAMGGKCVFLHLGSGLCGGSRTPISGLEDPCSIR